MLKALILAAAMSAVPAAPLPDNGVKTVAPVCQQTGPQRASESDGALFQRNRDYMLMSGTRKLSQEPNADAIAAVLYSEGQCSRPIVVSRNVGNNPKRK